MNFERVFFPQKGRLTFDGGLNTKFEKSIIGDTESPDCANVLFQNGAVGTRWGTEKLNTSAVGSFACHGLYTRHDQTGSQTMVAFFGGKAYAWTGSTMTTIPSSVSVFTAGTRVCSSEMENYAFFNNGQIGYKYNGTDWNRHGIYPPTVSAAVATYATAGNLTGTYTWKVTYRNSGLVESDVNPVTPSWVGVGESASLTCLPVAPASWGVAARVIYRKSSAASTYNRVAVIADNTTTTYQDNIADASLGAAAPTDQGVPPRYSAIAYHQSRLFFNDDANPNYVWFSEVANPYVVKTTNFFRIGDNSSDLVRGLGVFDNSLYVFCDNSTWLIYMPSQDEAEWIQVRVKSPYGSKSPFGIVNFNNSLFAPALVNDKLVGFAQITGNAIQPSATLLSVSSAGSDRLSDRIEPDIFNIQTAYQKNISSIVFKNMIFTTVTYGSGQTANNRIYVLDFSIENLNRANQAAWIPWTGLTPEQFTILDGTLYFGTSAATGYVYKFSESVYSDDGSAINSYFWTKEFGGSKGDFTLTKDFRFANILLENAGDWNMQVKYRVDSDKGSGDTANINLDAGGSNWGTMVWGADSWGGGTYQREERVYLDQKRGRRIQFQFNNTNTAGSWFKVHNLNFVYNVKGLR